MGQEVGWAVLAGWGEVAMACVSRREVMGGGGVRGGCSPWGSGEDQLLGGGRIGVSGRKGPTSGPWICQTKEVTASFWEPAEEGRGGTGLEAFPLPGERAPGCSWLLAGASNLAAAGDLDAWHSRAAGLFCCGPPPLCFLAAQPFPLHLALPLPLLLWEERVDTKAE